jgi:hypothetical protein
MTYNININDAVKQYLETTPPRDWSPAGAAEFIGISYGTFRRRCRDANFSMRNVIHSKKIDIALTRIRAGEPLKCISGDLGYSHDQALGRLLRSHGIFAREEKRRDAA